MFALTVSTEGGHLTVDERDEAPGRLRSIDILRGVAILWVVTFHLWGDMEYFPGVPRVYYEQLTWQLKHGQGPWAVFTSFTDLLFRDGFQGVPLFMMISGVSLTIAAYRSGGSPCWPRFFAARFRKLLAPYWAGVAIGYAVIAAIAWRQASNGGVSFASQFGDGVTISLRTIVHINPGVVIASLTLLPRLTGANYFFAPQMALWFVGLLAQYYLLFPLLLFLMRRIGVGPFLLLTLAATIASNAVIVHEYGALELKFWLVTGWFPFRLFEFTAGMGIGWLLAAPEASGWRAALRDPRAAVLLVVSGLAAHTAGDLLIGRWTVDQLVRQDNMLYLQALALPVTTLGLALLALPLLVRRPSRVDALAPVRAFATLGVMSYAILIVNDPMRLVASQLRVEGVSGAAWWLFLVGVYVPVSVLIAWPLAHLLGLMPARAKPASSRDTAPAEVAPALRQIEVVEAIAGGG